jgi:predicted naringenin-chalcone synthase
VESSLASHGLRIGDVHGWAIHPGGPRVIDAVRDALGLPEESASHSRAVLRDHGNMSSATLPFILRALSQERVPRPWAGLAFGPGLAGELVVIR